MGDEDNFDAADSDDDYSAPEAVEDNSYDAFEEPATEELDNNDVSYESSEVVEEDNSDDNSDAYDIYNSNADEEFVATDEEDASPVAEDSSYGVIDYSSDNESVDDYEAPALED